MPAQAQKTLKYHARPRMRFLHCLISFLFIQCTLMIVLGAWRLYEEHIGAGLLLTGISLVGVGVCAFTVRSTIRLFRQPILVIAPDGITVNEPSGKIFHAPWQEIRDFSVSPHADSDGPPYSELTLKSIPSPSIDLQLPFFHQSTRYEIIDAIIQRLNDRGLTINLTVF